jgi:toxin ParE1/3/4
MTGAAPDWTVRLSKRAHADYQDILTWAAEEFGELQASAYREVLSSAIDALADGPGVAGVKKRSDLGCSVLALHVAPGRNKGRHVIFFHVVPAQSHTIEVIRILHDALDFARHIRGKRA